MGKVNRRKTQILMTCPLYFDNINPQNNLWTLQTILISTIVTTEGDSVAEGLLWRSAWRGVGLEA